MEHSGDASLESDWSSFVHESASWKYLGSAIRKTTFELLMASRWTHLASEWTMSRRPNKRESSENAPGPRRKRTAFTQNEKANRKSSGSYARRNMKIRNKTQTQQVIGVNKPRQNAATTITTAANSQV